MVSCTEVTTESDRRGVERALHPHARSGTLRSNSVLNLLGPESEVPALRDNFRLELAGWNSNKDPDPVHRHIRQCQRTTPYGENNCASVGNKDRSGRRSVHRPGGRRDKPIRVTSVTHSP